MGKLHVDSVAVTTTGSNGSATGTGYTSGKLYNGRIWWIYLDYHADAPSSTDVTISYETRGGNIMTEADSKTDAMYHPRAKMVDNAETAITNSHDHFVVHNDRVKVAVAGSNALTACVTAYICWEDMAS